MRLRWLLVLVQLAVGLGNGQQQSDPESNCAIKEIINAKGWAIPGLRGAKEQGKGLVMTGIGIDDVVAQSLRPNSRVEQLTLVSRSKETRGAVELREQALQVDSIVQYRRYGRVFAYKIKAPLLGSSSPRSHLGSVELLYFYDPEGGGRFSVMRYAGEVGFVPVVPAWVKALTPQGDK
jgi:hypothetical protein